MEKEVEEPFRVGAFLDVLNESFAGMRVSIRGEVSGIEERRGITYFSLKDTEEEGMLSCLIFRSDFFLQGIRLEEGQEIVVEGSPQVWKPRGRLSFRVSIIRYAGMGALKKAYDELRGRLEREGLFREDRKRLIPLFPERIALVTSKEGAALGDFAANIGRRGFSIALFDAHVEGKRAVAELIEGIRYFNRAPKAWDVLLLVRGGGSLESLEAFNSEMLVRAIAESKIPTIAGIGHEKDVSLSALAADRMVSTPTAAARALGESWDRATESLSLSEQTIFKSFLDSLEGENRRIRENSHLFSSFLGKFVLRFRKSEESCAQSIFIFSRWVAECRRRLDEKWENIIRSFVPSFPLVERHAAEMFANIERLSPRGILARGYSILRKEKRVVRSVSVLAKGDTFEALLLDGSICARRE